MNESEVRSAIAAQMARIAPEIDINGIDPQADLRRTLDIDSFDLLKLLIGLHETLGVEIPETDYGKLRSLNALVSYLLSHA